MSYRAVFYSGDKTIIVCDSKNSKEEAQEDINRMKKTYEVFVYTPWTHVEVEEIK